MTLSALQNLARRPKLDDLKLLEIGAGNATFVERVSPSLIPRNSVVCTEYSDAGYSQIRKRGYQCEKIDFRDVAMDRFRGQFHAICMFQVLEHMDGPDEVFQRLRELSTPNGHLFIAVPNCRQREYYDLHGVHEDIPPIHVTRWTRQALKLAGEKNGWRILEDKIEPQGYFRKIGRYSLVRFLQSRAYHYVGQVSSNAGRVVVKITGACAMLMASPRALMGLRREGLGVSYWVHFVRCNERIEE